MHSYIKQCRLLKKKQDKNKYSLQAVASRIGVSESYLSRIERGEVPNRRRLEQLITDLDANRTLALASFGFLDEKIADAINANLSKWDVELDSDEIYELVSRTIEWQEFRAILFSLKEMRRRDLGEIKRFVVDGLS
ncbi:helix-turn-helix domain-containing protein [Salinimonas iocasae]|uniref:Helix-turn-helix transcriptional regulator n=1 Tax=Salinimonas iocasae TaxID=2572577 RepID=A0A5B7YIN7_9ALTE|nr:helix-turn-helix transcriptional regulator [Salinimonas iocasae]QCZ94379.1 helix-turn-helix transcriptional regulator [Salinimonas iocasae]